MVLLLAVRDDGSCKWPFEGLCCTQATISVETFAKSSRLGEMLSEFRTIWPESNNNLNSSVSKSVQYRRHIDIELPELSTSAHNFSREMLLFVVVLQDH